MLKVTLQKIWHKKWMVLCLLLGCILLVATVVSFPLYRHAAFDRMIQDEFDQYVDETGLWPCLDKLTVNVKKDREGATVTRMENTLNDLSQGLGVTPKEKIRYYYLAKSSIHSTMNRTDMWLDGMRLAMVSGLPSHARMISGEMYSEEGVTQDGALEAVVGQECLINNNLLVGEVLEFDNLKDVEGNKIRVKIMGVFEEADKTDFYWQVKPSDLKSACIVNEEVFRKYFLGENAYHYTLTCNYYHLFEYEDLTAAKADNLIERARYYYEESSIRNILGANQYREILQSYLAKRTRIEAALFILQVPVLILLCAFLFMISGQMYDMERNEISVMKSRGGSSAQMFRLYLYQSVFLTGIGAALGIPLGTVFCRILGSTQNFLEFTARRSLQVTFDESVWRYAAAAVAGSILIMTLPALKHSRLTIVKLKQSNALKKTAIWEKFFLDFILLGISLYGYYSFRQNQAALAGQVMEGQSLDPLLYASSSLFILGMGLVFLRIQPWLIRLVYILGKRFWRPASYASFVENIKNGRKQQFIMLFMILTISLGMYHAVVARTILQNAEDNADYLETADIVIKEVWNRMPTGPDVPAGTGAGQFIEPEFSRFSAIPGVAQATRVYVDELAQVKNKENTKLSVTLLGIHTREYGQVTQMEDGLLPKAYYEYLNELAAEPGGVLVSANFRDMLGFQVGDSIDLTEQYGGSMSGKIVDFFEYWPGYEPAPLSMKADGTTQRSDNFLVIANIATVQKNIGVYPYEVWIRLQSPGDTEGIYTWMKEKDIHVVKFRDKAKELQKVVQDPLLQGTNGVLTMGFIVTIILCAVGYLIYWIMSIRSREMIFGVLRACGMHKGELFHMLINEQIFSGVLSIFAGIGIGYLTSDMFVPMLQTAYAASNQVLPMKLIVNQTDMNRLYLVIAGVMIVCLLVLLVLVLRLNITKALKLGEE